MLKWYSVLIEVDTDTLSNECGGDFCDRMVVRELGWCKQSGISTIIVEEVEQKFVQDQLGDGLYI